MMRRSEAILKYSLLAGSVYFSCMALAHYLGEKAPLLFVYYDVPSHHYQDLIISFCAAGYAAFFLCSRSKPVSCSRVSSGHGFCGAGIGEYQCIRVPGGHDA
jgi:hypothetical protein